MRKKESNPKKQELGSMKDIVIDDMIYRNSLDNMLEGIQIIGFDWRYLYVNDAVSKHGHYRKDELMGYTMMEKYTGIENTAVFAIMQECMKCRVARRLENEFEYPDKSKGWFDLSIEPVPEGIMVLSLDITERKRAEERALAMLEHKVQEQTRELTESLEREKKLNEMKSRFVSMASHEFRTPLATILSSLSLIRAYYKPEHEEIKAKHINRIDTSVRDLTEILNDFLSLEQLQKGFAQTEKEVFNLPEFLGSIVDEMGVVASKKKQQIKYDHAGEDTIMGSKKTLKNVVLNLISNASKYSQERKEIYLISIVSDGKVSITIKDQGIGIPDQDQKKLFTEFFRAGNVGDIQGTGLGLCIVKKYMELLGGNIDFMSNPNDGTTFMIEFPCHYEKIQQP